jgi:phosphatidyl-myo-inositol dimannoside synthase
LAHLPPEAHDVTGRALLLTPSRGRGGGIERYAETLEWAFAAQDIGYARIDLRQPGARAHSRMVAEAHELLRLSAEPTRLVVVHRSLLPAASLLARQRHVRGVSVVCHGSDVWGTRQRARRRAERYLMRRPGVRVVAVSSYTAGALGGTCPAAILPPGLSGDWFGTLVGAAANAPRRGQGIHLLTTFRLPEWRSKGLPQLLGAVAALGRPDIHVTVCGTGVPPPELTRLVRDHARCSLRPGLSNSELACQLAAADLFILATRTVAGRDPSGEGFGLVLLEAQVAGTPVVAPAYGGSREAYLDGLSGVAPADETTQALARVLDDLLRDPHRLARMGRRAAQWARQRFAPAHYAARAVATLL